MTTWLPALCALIVALSTMWLATDPAFAHGRDRLLGAIIGLTIGLFIAVFVYGLAHFVAWAWPTLGG